MSAAIYRESALPKVNAISFSLYHVGTNVASSGIHYLTGAVRNAQLAPDIYPGWKVVVFCDPAVPEETRKQLTGFGADLRMVEGCSMFHRFLINDDPAIERYLVRDADSRINEREAGAVAEWIESGKSFHVIRDHPHHPQPIQGGLWGGTTGKIKSIASLMHGYNIKDRRYGEDMRFLADRLWPAIKEDCCQHDLVTHRQYVGARPFPAKMGDFRFCGEVFTHDDQPRKGDWERRANYMSV